MSPAIRKLALTAHVTVSVGWIGGAIVYLVIAAAAMRATSEDALRAAWTTLALVGWTMLVPAALAALVTGLVMALGTSWGLFRHYWVVVSLALTLIAAGVLLRHMMDVSAVVRAAGSGAMDAGALRGALRGELLHAGIGLLVLCAIETLNVYKPRGLTAHGRNRATADATTAAAATIVGAPVAARRPLWVWVLWIHAAGLALLYVILHLARDGGMRAH